MPTIETAVHVDRPPAEVWRVLTDFDGFSAWNPMMVEMRGRPEVGAPLKLAFVLREGGRRFRTAAKVLRCEPERELRWGGGVPGLLWVEHWVALTPEGTGTRVAHCESFRGLLARPGLWLIGASSAPYEAMNAALKRRVEMSSARLPPVQLSSARLSPVQSEATATRTE